MKKVVEQLNSSLLAKSGIVEVNAEKEKDDGKINLVLQVTFISDVTLLKDSEILFLVGMLKEDLEEVHSLLEMAKEDFIKGVGDDDARTN